MATQEIVTVPAPTERSLISAIIEASRNPEVDAAKLHALLDFQMRIEERDAKREFNEALSAMLPLLPRIVRDKKISLGQGKGEIPFGSYEEVMHVVGPFLERFKFTASFTSEETTSGVTMVMTFRHIGGHAETSKMHLPADKGPGRNDNQAIGSSRSYAKRYLLCDFLNIVFTNEDRDGGGSDPVLTREQCNQIYDLLLDCKMESTAAKPFLVYMAAVSVETIHQRDFVKAINMLQAKRRLVQQAR